ncbi:hypothetical protein BDV11DRAFT_61466 [Aspergillus similis]
MIPSLAVLCSSHNDGLATHQYLLFSLSCLFHVFHVELDGRMRKERKFRVGTCFIRHLQMLGSAIVVWDVWRGTLHLMTVSSPVNYLFVSSTSMTCFNSCATPRVLVCSFVRFTL